MYLDPDDEAIWPGLRRGEYRVTSPGTDEYNCFAWAANVTDRWWEPGSYWPIGDPKDLTLQVLVEAYRRLGFEHCDGPAAESGFEKIAIYVNDAGLPRHAARQLDSGVWTIKLGELPDIEHQLLEAVECEDCGAAGAFLKRRIERARGD